jgi:hypothetical protein
MSYNPVTKGVGDRQWDPLNNIGVFIVAARVVVTIRTITKCTIRGSKYGST